MDRYIARFVSYFPKIFILCIGVLLITNASLIGVMGTVSGRPSDELQQNTPSQSASQAIPMESDCDFSGEYRFAVEDGKVGEVRVERPKSLDNLEHPRKTVTTFADVTRLLNVSDSDQNTTVGVVSSENIDSWGFASGDNVCLKGDSRALWDGLMTHEYLHTRQEFAVNSEMEWIIEASAFYYMAVLPYERGTMSQSRANERLREPSWKEYTDDGKAPVLKGNSSYRVWSGRGAPVLAALDREIRNRTNGDRTLEHVFQRMSESDREITFSNFKRIVAEVAGENMDAWLKRYVAGTEPVGPQQSQVNGLTLTAPAANPEVDIESVSMSGKQTKGNPESPHLTIPEDQLEYLAVNISSSAEYPTYPTVRVFATDSEQGQTELGTRRNTGIEGPTTLVFPPSSESAGSVSNLEPGEYTLRIIAGQTKMYVTLSVVQEKTSSATSTPTETSTRTSPPTEAPTPTTERTEQVEEPDDNLSDLIDRVSRWFDSLF
ncbi:hypothetical protein RBH20_19510 [Haloarcula sp. H-GB4]|uniref:hypothetical protein n=1 Tax=Haloarcula sp. H-GB4 TaxID=3069755 RepID=UPI0027B1EF36|nr:hypothetical protein [Haloarcula sp. H-GB4]MDQ2074720.1 hypothetical protein [Haloarcula sp. H-GB4]